jgi:PAS domain S-box-containing protein
MPFGASAYLAKKFTTRHQEVEMLDLNTELAAIAVSILGGLGTGLSLLWMKVVKPLVSLINNQDYFKTAVEDIKKELNTNGGNSLKDAVIKLNSTCDRIERRQRVIEQRTKAGLHYSNVALFETDSEGRLIWNNNKLCEITDDSAKSLEGYDWLNCLHEDEREEVLHEFVSCLKMNRKFNRTTKTTTGQKIRMTGYPYKISEDEQGGFLVSISHMNEV